MEKKIINNFLIFEKEKAVIYITALKYFIILSFYNTVGTKKYTKNKIAMIKQTGETFHFAFSYFSPLIAFKIACTT